MRGVMRHAHDGDGYDDEGGRRDINRRNTRRKNMRSGPAGGTRRIVPARPATAVGSTNQPRKNQGAVVAVARANTKRREDETGRGRRAVVAGVERRVERMRRPRRGWRDELGGASELLEGVLTDRLTGHRRRLSRARRIRRRPGGRGRCFHGQSRRCILGWGVSGGSCARGGAVGRHWRGVCRCTRA
jgi:hypothetical protein